jgi:hypothetical protein
MKAAAWWARSSPAAASRERVGVRMLVWEEERVALVGS